MGLLDSLKQVTFQLLGHLVQTIQSGVVAILNWPFEDDAFQISFTKQDEAAV